MEKKRSVSSCYLCNGKDFIRRPGVVRDNSELDILECRGCGLVFLSSFDHIKKKFYESSGMHGTNFNLKRWIKETIRDDERRFNQFKHCMINRSVLDFGCGTGGFILKARDVAKAVTGIEPEKQVQPHFIKNGLRVYTNIDKVSQFFDVITLFHVLEHIPDPIILLKKIAKRLSGEGRIIIEVPHANDALLKLYKCKEFNRFTYWGCHLFLFTEPTLAMAIKKAGLVMNYVKQFQRHPLSNHLYWLKAGKPGGHKKWSFLDSPELKIAYEKQLASLGYCDTIIASCSRKPQ